MAQKSSRHASESWWNLDEIQSLMDLLAKREISEFELEKDGLRIRIKRGESTSGGGSTAVHAYVPVPAPHPTFHAAPVPAPSPVAAPPSAASPEASETPTEQAEGLHTVKSPMVGTFYNSPAPDAAPFVKVGDSIQAGQVLCIVEAMKLMNEIESDAAGELVRVYVESGQPVEYGQSLFAIKPFGKK